MSPSIALFYDTETSGLPLFSEPSEDPRQPHIVQIGAQLVNLDTRVVIQAIDIIVRPNGWVIPDEVAAVHGITTEMAYDLGVPEEAVASMFYELWRPLDPRLRIGHNESFDARIMRIALKRFFGDTEADIWKAGTAECTQKLSTPILKLPPTAKMKAFGRNHHKSANLREAYEFFTGQPLSGAHNAMVDVDGCKTVYFAIKDRQLQAA
ncbi:MAG: 3'-5' exonuclease [Aquabacterium sp.]